MGFINGSLAIAMIVLMASNAYSRVRLIKSNPGSTSYSVMIDSDHSDIIKVTECESQSLQEDCAGEVLSNIELYKYLSQMASDVGPFSHSHPEESLAEIPNVTDIRRLSRRNFEYVKNLEVTLAIKNMISDEITYFVFLGNPTFHTISYSQGDITIEKKVMINSGVWLEPFLTSGMKYRAVVDSAKRFSQFDESNPFRLYLPCPASLPIRASGLISLIGEYEQSISLAKLSFGRRFAKYWNSGNFPMTGGPYCEKYTYEDDAVHIEEKFFQNWAYPEWAKPLAVVEDRVRDYDRIFSRSAHLMPAGPK